MANAKDIHAGDTNILLVGDSGTYKTGFLGTIVDAGESLYVFDFDKGQATNRGKDYPFDTFKEVERGQTVSPEMKKLGLYNYGDAWPAFIKKLNELGKQMDAGTGPKNIALDSLTFLGFIAMSRVLLDTNQKDPHQGSWGAQQEFIKRVLGQVTAWPCRLICTAHIQRDKNDLTQVTEQLPLLTGKLAGFIGAFFDEVYFTDIEGEGANRKFVLRTQKSMVHRQAKSRWNVPDKTVCDFREVIKHFPKV